jgi:hypothetical protein
MASRREVGAVNVEEKAVICLVKDSHNFTFPNGTMRGRKEGRGEDVSDG